MTNLEIDKAYVGTDQVEKIYLGADVIWPTTPVYSAMPLTFEIISGGTVVWKSTNSSIARPIQYSKNHGEWVNIPGDTAGTSISVAAGDIISFKGENRGYALAEVGTTLKRVRFTGSTSRFKLYGNILSLCYADYEEHTGALDTGGYNFMGMFEGTRVTDASNLILPKTLYDDDLRYFFVGCTMLEIGPTIEANATASKCMQAMFSGCTNLNYVTCLATNISGSNSTSNWLAGVSATGTFVKAASMNSWPSGASGIPNGWTVQDA